MQEVEDIPFWDKGYRITNVVNLDGVINSTELCNYTRIMAGTLKNNSVTNYIGTGAFFILMDNPTLSHLLACAAKPDDYEITALQSIFALAEGETELTTEMIRDTRVALHFLLAFEASCRLNFATPDRRSYSMFIGNMQAKCFDKPMEYFYFIFDQQGSEGLNREVKNAILEHAKNKRT